MFQEIDPNAILPVKIRPNAQKVNYASKEAYEKAGLTPADVEKEEFEDDGEFVNLEDVEEEQPSTAAVGDHSMQQ